MENSLENDKLRLFEEISKLGIDVYKTPDFDVTDAVEIDENTVKSVSGLSSAFLVFPAVAEKIGYQGALFAELKPDTHMAKDASGKFLGSLLSNKNNSVAGQARFSLAQPRGADIVSIVFTVMAFITGQYYMSEIDGSFGKVSGHLLDLISISKDKDISEIYTNFNHLKVIKDDYKFYMNKPERVQTHVIELNDIVRESEKEVRFFEERLSDLYNNMRSKKKGAKSTSDVLQALDEVSYYMLLSLYNYGLSITLRMVLEGIIDREEIDTNKNRVVDFYNESIDILTETRMNIETYMGTKGYVKKIKKECREVVKGLLKGLFIPFPFNFIKIHRDSKKKTGELRKINKEIFDGWNRNVSSTLEQIDPIHPIKVYENLINNKIILIYKDNRYFVKQLDENNNEIDNCELVRII